MGGLGPGIGGLEYLVIGIVALLVVGPERLPGMLRQLGKMVGKARGMANEFRASFDEMARQSELDDLRKEVEALRTGQGMHPLGADAEAAFKDIRKDLEAPLDTPALAAPVVVEAAPVATGVDEWPDTPLAAEPVVTAKPKPKAKTKAKTVASTSSSIKPAASKPAVKRAKKVEL